MTTQEEPVCEEGARKRRYESPIRRAQAAATRATIVEAAARAFSARGFSKTPVSAIAREAGVSVQTLYDSVGGKRDLLLAVLDRIDEAHFPEILARLEVCQEPSQAIRTWVHGLRRYMEGNATLVRAALEAGDADARAVVDAGHSRHLGGARQLVRSLEARGALQPCMDARSAAIAVAMVTADSAWYFAVDAGGMTWDETEELIADSVTRLLVGNGGFRHPC